MDSSASSSCSRRTYNLWPKQICSIKRSKLTLFHTFFCSPRTNTTRGSEWGRAKKILKIATDRPTRPDQIKPNQTKPNQTRSDQTKPDETKPNQTRPNQTRPNQTKQTKPDQTRPDQTRPDQTRPKQTRTNQTRPNQTRPSQTRPDQTKPNRTRPNQTRPNQTRPDQTRPDQTRPNKPNQTKSDQTKPDQTKPDQTKPTSQPNLRNALSIEKRYKPHRTSNRRGTIPTHTQIITNGAERFFGSLRNLKLLFPCLQNPPLATFLSQINAIHTLPLYEYFFKIYYPSIYALIFEAASILQVYKAKPCNHFSSLLVCHLPSSARHPAFVHPSNVWWGP